MDADSTTDPTRSDDTAEHDVEGAPRHVSVSDPGTVPGAGLGGRPVGQPGSAPASGTVSEGSGYEPDDAGEPQPVGGDVPASEDSNPLGGHGVTSATSADAD